MLLFVVYLAAYYWFGCWWLVCDFLLAWAIVSGCDLVCFVYLIVVACCCVGVLRFGFVNLGCGEFCLFCFGFVLGVCYG